MAFNVSTSNAKPSFNPMATVNAGENAMQTLLDCKNSGSRNVMIAEAKNAEKLYGLDLLYYKQQFDPKKAHPIYGDQNTPFKGPYLIKALIDIATDTSILTQLGIETSNDIELQITFDTWFAVFGKEQPQAGDKFEVKDLLCSRPNGFERAIFEITSQGEGDIFDLTNKWFLRAERSDFAWMPNEPKEEKGEQVTMSGAGLLDNETLEPIPESYDENSLAKDIDELADANYPTNEHSKVYGGYYVDNDDL